MPDNGFTEIRNNKKGEVMIKKISEFQKWMLYSILVAFAAYWAANLILWIPWTINPTFGMIMMLTVGTVLWLYVIYICLLRYSGSNLYKASLIIGLLFLLVSGLLDFIFFGLIRGAMEDLYHPTTFYGYGFLIVLPFLLTYIFSKKIKKNNKDIFKKSFIKAVIIGMLCLTGTTILAYA